MGVFILSVGVRSASRGARFHGEMARPETQAVALSEGRKTTVYQAKTRHTLLKNEIKNKPSIKQIYNVDYDTSALQSGLIKWYNRLLDKTVDELDEVDVSKMIRQNILPELAIARAITILDNNPFTGEMHDGDILNALCVLIENGQLNSTQIKMITEIKRKARQQIPNL